MLTRTRSIVRWLAVALTFCLAANPAALAGAPATPTGQWSAVLPADQAFLQQHISGDLSTYTVTADFTPASGTTLATIDGHLALDWVNPSDQPLNSAPIRLYANDPRYQDGAISVRDVTVDGQAVSPDASSDTDIAIPFAQPLAAGAHTEIDLSFTATIPNDIQTGYGMFQHDSATDAYTLDHWLPLVAGYDPANGFELDPISVNGDPVFSSISYFDITLTAPTSDVIASTGTEAASTDVQGGTQHHYVSGPVRDFAMAISPNFKIATGDANGTTVRSYYLTGHQERGEKALGWAETELQLFDALFGAYPYAQLSLVDAPIGGGAAGIEFPQMVFIASWYYGEPLDHETIPHGQEFTVVHEVLHQWFYGMVGNNQYLHPFLDESVVNYLSTIYFERVYGNEVANQQLVLNITAPYLVWLYGIGGTAHDDEVVDTPSDSFPSEFDYSVIIYNKGPLALQAIRKAMNDDDAFFGALSAYFKANALGIAQPADLEAAFEAASSSDIASVWTHWFDEADGKSDFTRQQAQQILQSIGH